MNLHTQAQTQARVATVALPDPFYLYLRITLYPNIGTVAQV